MDTPRRIAWEGHIAPIAGAIKITGKDGGWRATFEGGSDSLTAMFALAAMINEDGQGLRIIVEPFTPPRYGTRDDD